MLLNIRNNCLKVKDYTTLGTKKNRSVKWSEAQSTMIEWQRS